MAPGSSHSFLVLTILLAQGLAEIVKEYTFIEEQPPNTQIANLTTDLGLDLKIPPEYHKDIKFQFLQQSEQYKPYFRIQDVTGLFTTKTTLNRETLCPLNDKCDITLDISILPARYFEIFKIIIHLIDINDNPPHFPTATKSLFISETTAKGASFAIPAATDGDSSKFGIQRYLLQPNSNVFELDVGSGSTGGGAGLSDPRLILRNSLDREKESFYSLKVLAIDGGIPAETGTMTVKITVTDANDNPPKFDNNTYQVSIEENTPIGTEILQVHAEDTDSGDNGKVVYTFSPNTAANFGHLFAMDSRSGSITVRGQIDYDLSPVHQYTLSIVASDSGENALSDYASVNIFITDINDNEPKILLNIDGDDNTVEISENSPIEEFVTHISVVDPDQGKGGEVECQLNHPNFTLIKLNSPKQYKLQTASMLDREKQDQYRVSVTCQDGGTPTPKISTQFIKITITDENDQKPEFEQPFYPVQVHENNPTNIQIAQVKATDEDIGDNARITYSILKPYDDILAIDEQNGFIWTKTVFDYEYKKTYEITVMAQDNGNPPLSANITVNLTIMDVNDEPPKFNQTHYTFGTLENQHAGTEIGVVEATDLDSIPFNDVVYTIDIQSPDANVFKIPDTRVGRITTRKVLDREQQDKYSILVIASNPGYSLRSVTNVTIYVGDQNDNSPQIEFPSDKNNTVQVSSFAVKGELVTQIVAHDDDVGRNSYLQYSIIAGNIHSMFMINPNTGEIFVNKSLESYKEKTLKLSLSVRDKGTSPLYAMTELQIYINSSQTLLNSAPVTKSATNLQLIIILCLSLLAISLFLAVLIVLVNMKRKKKAKQQDSRYKVDISVNVENTLSSSSTDSPAAVRKDGTESNRHGDKSYDSTDNPPPYTEANPSPNMTYITRGDARPDTRKVHFAEANLSYDSLNKDNDDHNTTSDSNTPYLQLQPGASRGGRPTFMEQQRQRLLYRSPNGTAGRSLDDIHIQNNGDIESDQGSSIDSGRGPSEDEHGRLNTSLQGPNISFQPDPHSRHNKKHNNTRTYPDLVKCICGALNQNKLQQQHYISPVHSKGCPQYQSPKHDSGNRIDNLHDFQNLLGLPPKTYNKRKNNNLNMKNNLNIPGQYSEGSVSSSPHSNNSRHNNQLSSSSNSNNLHPLDSSYSSNAPQTPDPTTNNFTQQCYDDIAKQKNSKYNPGGSSSNTSSRQHRPHHHPHRHPRDSWGRGEESDGESDGGSTTTSGSFSVIGSVENVMPPTKPVQQIHQVYV